jgi:hypothetical protein
MDNEGMARLHDRERRRREASSTKGTAQPPFKVLALVFRRAKADGPHSFEYLCCCCYDPRILNRRPYHQ